jgi:DNA-binding IclR family transcriptional regulator
MAPKHLFVASAIGLFEQLADGPITLDEVATCSGVPRRTVRILADALVALGLVSRRGGHVSAEPGG